MGEELKLEKSDRNTNLIYIALALSVVYIFWGGIYLATRFAVETIPPFLMSGGRFVLAGILLYVVARYQGDVIPSRRDWIVAGKVGIILLTGGNGGLVLAAKIVPSGINALMYASIPLWMALLNWLWLKSAFPGWITSLAISLGLVGITLLTGVDTPILGGSLNYMEGTVICTIGAFLWALGSIYSRRAGMPESVVMSTALQMLVGGSAFFLLGLVSGEWSQFSFAAISFKSKIAFLYIVIFGSVAALSAYVWLLQNASPILVSTYAYVCPIIAIVLGLFFGNELMSWRIVVAGLVIVTSVILITFENLPKKTEPKHYANVTEAKREPY